MGGESFQERAELIRAFIGKLHAANKTLCDVRIFECVLHLVDYVEEIKFRQPNIEIINKVYDNLLIHEHNHTLVKIETKLAGKSTENVDADIQNIRELRHLTYEVSEMIMRNLEFQINRRLKDRSDNKMI